MSQRTGEEPKEVIDALREWLDLRSTDETYKASGLYEAVRYWVYGDELEDDVNIVPGPDHPKAIYLIDGEDDPDNPIVVKVEITEVINYPDAHSTKLEDYLEQVVGYFAEDFNAEAVDTLDRVRIVLETWKLQDDDSQMDIDAILQGQEKL